MKRRVLAWGAHPDDIEFGCAGAELGLKDQGYELFHACLTSGESGSDSLPPGVLGRRREEEAREAGRVLGVEELRLLRFPDGLTAVTREMKIAVIEVLRDLRPDVVFVHAPDDTFPDHRLLSQLVCDAVLGAEGPWFPEAGGRPFRVPALYGYEVWHPIPAPPLLVDITRTLPLKLEALSCHRSQLSRVSYVEAARGLAAYRGAMGHTGLYAEAFAVLRTPSTLGV